MKIIASIILIILLTGAACAQQRSFKDFVKEPAFQVKVAGSTLDFCTSLKIDGVHFR